MSKLLTAFAALAFASTAIAQDDSPPQMPRGGGMPSPDQIFAFMDANKDGFIAKDEAKGPMVQHFEHLDGDKDGKISPDELKNAMAAMRPPEPPQGEPEAPAD
jgi:EF hand